jgi:hypothetical protein
MSIRPLWDAGDPQEPDGFYAWGRAVSDYTDGLVVERPVQLRTSDPVAWIERVFSTEDAVCPATVLTIEHGTIVLRGSGGAGNRSNRRSAFVIPGSPGGYSRIRSRLSGTPANPAASGLLPQRGHAHGIQQDPTTGQWTAVVVSHDIVFDLGYFWNLSIWRSETAPGGTGSQFLPGDYMDDVAVTAAARTTNVVTLTVPTGHGFVARDVIVVDLADASYDGTFVVTSVTATTIVYAQTAANAGTSTGSVRLYRSGNIKLNELTRTTAFSAAARTNGIVTATVAAGHGWVQGEEIAVDAADTGYRGVFKITDTTSSPTSIKWIQAAADDVSAGAGTITNVFPLWLETEWWPGMVRARVFPGNALAATPSWESPYAIAADITALAAPEPDPLLGEGCGIIAAHPASSASATPTDMRYDTVQTAPLNPLAV